MKCLYCTTELPIDSNTNHVTCPKCGSEFNIIHAQGQRIAVEHDDSPGPVLDFDQINQQIIDDNLA